MGIMRLLLIIWLQSVCNISKYRIQSQWYSRSVLFVILQAQFIEYRIPNFQIIDLRYNQIIMHAIDDCFPSKHDIPLPSTRIIHFIFFSLALFWVLCCQYCWCRLLSFTRVVVFQSSPFRYPNEVFFRSLFSVVCVCVRRVLRPIPFIHIFNIPNLVRGQYQRL